MLHQVEWFSSSCTNNYKFYPNKKKLIVYKPSDEDFLVLWQ